MNTWSKEINLDDYAECKEFRIHYYTRRMNGGYNSHLFWLNHKFCGISDSSRSSVGSYRIASERNIRHQDIRIPVCEES